MFLFPFVRFDIKAKCLKDEIEQKLSRDMDKKYKIKIKDHEFVISNWIGRGISVIINGQIKNQSINVVVRPSYPTSIIMIIFLIITFIYAKRDTAYFTLSLLILIMIYIYLAVMTKYLAKKFNSIFTKILEK